MAGVPHARHRAPVLALVAVLLLALVPPRGPAGARGQEAGTPDASPAASVPADNLPPVPCAVPDGGPADPADPESSDGTDIVPAGADAGPESAPPAASPAPGDPVDPATADQVEQTVRVLAACLSEANIGVTIELTTPAYRGVLAGAGQPLSRSEYSAVASALPVVPVAVRAVAEIRTVAAGVVSAEVTYVYGNQLLRGRWTLLAVPTAGAAPAATPEASPEPEAAPGAATTRRFRVDAEEPLEVPVPDGAAVVAVGLREYAINARTQADGPDVALAIANRGAEEHEVLALRLDGEAAAADLLRAPGPGLPEGVAFAGQLTVPSGGEANLVLVDLEPGRYALVCLFPDADGTPHLALGMEAELTVR